MYGFNKQKNSNGVHEFKHEFFKKGDISSLAKIQRKLNEQPENKGESFVELKNLQYEYSRLQKVNKEFEDSLKVLIKQNKKLMEANRQLVYQFYYFKKESDLKSKKLMFLMYCLLNGKENLKEHLRNKILEVVNPSYKTSSDQIDFKIMMKELDSNTDEQLFSNPVVLKEMINSLFCSNDKKSTQPIDTIIEEYVRSNIDNSHNKNNHNNFGREFMLGSMGSQLRIEDSKLNLNEDLDEKNLFDKNNLKNNFNNMPYQTNGNKSSIQSLFCYNDGSDHRSLMKSFNKSKMTENNSLMSRENQSQALDCIENNLINYRFHNNEDNIYKP